MTRLIDADALKNSIDEHVYLVHHGFNETEYGCTQYGIHQIIDEAPTIDAEPVRHGKWADDALGVLRCSECKAQAPWRFNGRGYYEVDYRWKADYCPNCVARMDERKEE